VGVMDGLSVWVGRRGSLTALVEPLSLSNEMGGGGQQAMVHRPSPVSDGERWTTVDPQRVPQNRHSESSMPVSFRRCRSSARLFP